MILEVRKAQITYYLLYIHKWDNQTQRSTHVTYRAVRTTATPDKWRTDPNIETSIAIPDRILHIFTEEPELLSILDYQPMFTCIGDIPVVVQQYIDKSNLSKTIIPLRRSPTHQMT